MGTLKYKTAGAFVPFAAASGPTIIGPSPGIPVVELQWAGAVPDHFANGGDGSNGSGTGSNSAWARAQKLVIKNGVTAIGSYALNNWNSCQEIIWPSSGLTSIGNYGMQNWRQFAGTLTLPEGLTGIGTYGFGYWVAATGLVIPSTLTSISGLAAFASWTSCLSLTIPDTVTTLGSAFSNWHAATLLDIGTGITSIGTQTFYNWTSLQTMICRATTPPTITTNSLQRMRAAAKIYVPDASVAAYKAATYWSARSAYIFGISTMP